MQHNPRNEGPDQPSSAQPESKTRDATAGLAIGMMLLIRLSTLCAPANGTPSFEGARYVTAGKHSRAALSRLSAGSRPTVSLAASAQTCFPGVDNEHPNAIRPTHPFAQRG